EEFSKQKPNGQRAGHEHARAVVVSHTIRDTSVFASANANEHARYADAAGFTVRVTTNANEHARYANAIGFAASFASTENGYEYADARSKPIGESHGPDARHGHERNEYEYGTVDGYDRQ